MDVDRDLLRAARRNDWEVLRFSNPVPLRERVPMPKPQHAAIGGGAVVLLLAASLAARWWWARRQPSVPVAPLEKMSRTSTSALPSQRPRASIVSPAFSPAGR